MIVSGINTPMVVPTYVGVIPQTIRQGVHAVSGPHVCGGDPERLHLEKSTVLWSPRMWG